MRRLKKNVLIFPGGTENGLEIKRSLQWCKEINIFSASSDVCNQAHYVYKDNSIIDDVSTNTWLEQLNDVIKKKKIDIIIPANSIVIDALNENRERIACDILLDKPEIIEITRSKRKTLEKLKNVVKVPQIYQSPDDIKEEDYPVFIKPDNGYGAQGAQMINRKSELEHLDFTKYIIQEYLEGDEYTVDCFSNHGDVLFARGRKRERIRMGTTMHCDELNENLQNEFHDLAVEIGRIIPITGYWFYQMKEDSLGVMRLLEIDIRIAGTMAYHRCKGVNFPLIALYQFYGYEIEVNPNLNYELVLDRCLKNVFCLKYEYNCVYIDLDDTIICHNHLNTQMVTFLYQCLNKGRKLVLISKNEEQYERLKKYRIYELFDEIYWIDESENKADYIKEKKAIFIDDSFSQRAEVKRKCHIPTFDPSMVECLLDEREM